MGPYRSVKKFRKVFKDERLGKFGEIVIELLPKDLAFTVFFIPSEKAFERDLKLQVHDSLVTEKMNDTYAVLSIILGFLAIHRSISSVTVSFDLRKREMIMDAEFWATSSA